MGKVRITTVLVSFVLSTYAWAQTSNATLGGTVSDPTGALIPGASITAVNTQTGIVSTTVSNEAGAYQFPSLQTGNYTVKAELPGFQTHTYNEVLLGVSQQVRLNFTLQVSSVATAVEVSVAADTLLATSAASRGSGQVQMVTRSGTNQLRGSIFGTNRNSALDANTWFNNFNRVGKNYDNRNQYGGRISGPIIKNKTFFFFLFEGQRYIARESFVGPVLTDQARQGIFRFFPGVDNGNAVSNRPTVDLQGNPVRPSTATGDLQFFSVFGRDPNRPGFDTSAWGREIVRRMPPANDFTIGDGLNKIGRASCR